MILKYRFDYMPELVLADTPSIVYQIGDIDLISEAFYF